MRRSCAGRLQLALLLIAIVAVIFLSTADSDFETSVIERDIADLEVTKMSGETGVGRLPDCIIIGARKAGTRIVLAMLNRHPKVKIVGPELGFFNSASTYQKGLSWYSQQMPNATSDEVVIEKTADYFQYSEAPERIHAMNPGIKLILVIRDPIERMISDYYFIQRYASRVSSAYHFQEVNKTLEELVINSTTNKINYSYGGICRSSYAKLIQPWLRWFPRKQIHVVNGDNIAKNNPAQELRQAEKFLGLRPFTKDRHFYYDNDKGYWCLRGGCFGAEKGHVHPPLDPEIRGRLFRHFWRSNQEFFALMGRDYGW